MAQIVFCVFKNELHEGSFLQGIFSTMKIANDRVTEFENKYIDDKYVSFDVTSMTVDEI